MTKASSATLRNTIAWNNQGDDFEADPTASISATFTPLQRAAGGLHLTSDTWRYVAIGS